MLTQTVAVQTSRQLKAHLLCKECEQLINKNGENWVLKHGLKADGSFPIASALADQKPANSDVGSKLYFAEGLAALNVPDLAYFGSSIFWRGSIHPWNTDGTTPIKLGLYQEEFRRYLCGQSTFPENASLMLIVREAIETSRITYFPYSEKMFGIRIHKFVISGFAFTLAVGKDVREDLRTLCLVRGSHNPILVTKNIESGILKMGVKMLAQHGRKSVTL